MNAAGSAKAARDPELECSEQELVCRIRAGDESAFDTLFRATYRPLVGFAASYVGSVESAEELVQDTLADVWARRETWAVHHSVRAYLYALVRNRALNEVRRQRVVTHLADQAPRDAMLTDGVPPGMGRGSDAADRMVAARDLSAAMDRAVADLPLGVRRAFALRREHDLSYTDIAQALGLSLKRVEALLTQAHKALRVALASYR